MPLRIFITTDNHVGYNELDPVRGDDAAVSFDEAMSIAASRDVDFVLQCGDLFHINKPSKRSLYSVMKTLRRTCLGDKPIEFQVLNHGPLTLNDAATEYNHPNFEDPNYNIGLPVFAISGNHDDAGGSGSNSLISPLDVLSMSGLINHFGRIHDSTDIVVTPILIQKEGIRLALYGMASVRDERLYRTFRDNKVKFLRPREEPDSWYNILIVHQNHSQHGPTNFLPEQFLPNFMDLIIWGHEHECLIDPVENPNKGFKVMQPGSTVATSLSESELKEKHVAILTISPNKLMTCEKIPLNTVRPFAMKTVSISNDAQHIKPNDREVRAKVTTWLIEQVELLISEAIINWRVGRDPDATNPLPLIRLRVDYSGGYEVENTTRFSNRFIDRVANSNDVLHLIKKRQTGEGRLLPKISSISPDTNDKDGDGTNGVEQVGKLVHEYLTSEHLKILLERGMGEALTKFVEKDDKIALKVGVDDLVKSKVEELLDPVRGLNLADEQERQNELTHPTRTGGRTSTVTSRKAKSKNTKNDTIENEESDADRILSGDEDHQPQSNNYRGIPAHQMHSKRQAREKANIEIPVLADPNDELGDDSDGMFSSDNYS